MPKRKIEVKMVSYGIYSQWDRGSKQLPKIRKHTKQIPAELDIEFGYTLRILRAKGSKITFIMKHPPFCDDNGDVRPDFVGEEMINSNEWHFFLGDTVWLPLEDKCGEWELITMIDNKEVARMSFNIFNPNTLEQPAQPQETKDSDNSLECKTLSMESDPLFPFAWELYEASFPSKERRAKDYHFETMKKEAFNADVIVDNGNPIGILFWWDLADFRYVEHLATSATLRGRGYGDMILRRFIAESDKPIILEVEHPTEEISRRRIGFYERIGFTLNPHPYRHPSYQQIKDMFVELMIMSYPDPISAEELLRFTSQEFATIHFRS